MCQGDPLNMVITAMSTMACNDSFDTQKLTFYLYNFVLDALLAGISDSSSNILDGFMYYLAREIKW